MQRGLLGGHSRAGELRRQLASLGVCAKRLDSSLDTARRRSSMEDVAEKLIEATASTSTGPSPMKARHSSPFSATTHDDYARVPQEATEACHTRAKSVDMRMTVSLRDSDLTDEAGESGKPMRRSVSWPDWSENRYVNHGILFEVLISVQ